ncbi:MAG: hypothetical protein ACT4OX_09330 [Actinomycetota bacterium]
MALRIGLALGILAIAIVVALILEHRRPTAPPTQGRIVVPAQLDRTDFPRPDAPWLVVLWSSRLCESCQGLHEKIAPLESDDVAVVEVELQEQPELHRRYGLDAAPITQIIDADGVSHGSFEGAFNAADLWAAVAALRNA